MLLRTSSAVDPHHFVTPARLDIAVKVLLFDHLKHGLHDARVEGAYRRHIEGRTGGNERRSWKQSTDDYLQAARDLMTSMRVGGFDPERPVKLGSNLNLRGGAHRIACALVLDEPVFVRIVDKPGNAAVWDCTNMRAHGMGDGDIVMAESRLERLQDAARLRLG